LNLLASPFRSTCRRSSAMDLFVVPTIGFNLLYVLVISSCWAGRICAGPRESMLATTILPERTGHWTCAALSPGSANRTHRVARPAWCGLHHYERHFFEGLCLARSHKRCDGKVSKGSVDIAARRMWR
jgi:hypothetical protein